MPRKPASAKPRGVDNREKQARRNRRYRAMEDTLHRIAATATIAEARKLARETLAYRGEPNNEH